MPMMHRTTDIAPAVSARQAERPEPAAQPVADAADMMRGCPVSFAGGGAGGADLRAQAALVRQMTERAPVAAGRLMRSLQRDYGNRYVQRMLTRQADATTGVVQAQHEEEEEPIQARSIAGKPLQRKIVMATGGTPAWQEMRAADRRAFLTRHASTWGRRADRQLAARIAEDLAATGDDLRFDNEAELAREIRKRIVTSSVMVEAQMPASGVTGFAYPFRGAARYYGPRVNYDARDYWQPSVPDNYALRRDRARQQRMDAVGQDNDKAAVYGDPTKPYRFTLTTLGRRNPYTALVSLFNPQPVHKKSLIHCDYFVTLVHYRSFADALTPSEFNRRVQAGTIPMVLKWDGFDDIEASTATAAGTHLQMVIPTRRNDLVIGDHVYFFNHKAYDVLIQGVGGVWRLENAILVDRLRGVDYFLGHGSGYETEGGIKRKLLREYNNHVAQARQIIAATERGSARSRADARTRLARMFPTLVKRGNVYYLVGVNRVGVAINEPLRFLTEADIPGLYSPDTYVSAANPGTFYIVRRPVESR